jgi:hypothetical protein
LGADAIGPDAFHFSPQALGKEAAPPRATLKRAGSDWLITAGGKSCVLDDRLVSAALRTAGTVPRAIMKGDRCYIAIHGQRCWPYLVYSVAWPSGELVWSSLARPTAEVTFTGRGSFHHVWMVADGHELYLFGASDEVVYVEGLSLDDGHHTFAFTTCIPRLSGANQPTRSDE